MTGPSHVSVKIRNESFRYLTEFAKAARWNEVDNCLFKIICDRQVSDMRHQERNGSLTIYESPILHSLHYCGE